MNTNDLEKKKTLLTIQSKKRKKDFIRKLVVSNIKLLGRNIF